MEFSQTKQFIKAILFLIQNGISMLYPGEMA